MAVGDRYSVRQEDQLNGRVRLDVVVSDSNADAVAQAKAALPTQDQAGYSQGGQASPTAQIQSVGGEIGASGGEAIDQNTLTGLGPQGLSGGATGPQSYPVVPPADPVLPNRAGRINGTL